MEILRQTQAMKRVMQRIMLERELVQIVIGGRLSGLQLRMIA